MKKIPTTTSNILPYSQERIKALQSKPKRKKNTSPTNNLTNAISNYIRLCGGYAMRINVAGFYRPELGKYIRSGSTIGTPDVIAVVSGRFLGVEIKVGSDTQSPDQKAVQQYIEAADGFYVLATDFDSFKTDFDLILTKFKKA